MKINTRDKLIFASLVLLILSFILIPNLLFYLIKKLDYTWQIIAWTVVGSVIIVFAAISEISDKRGAAKKKTELLKIGRQILSNYEDEFSAFYNLYLTDKTKFLNQNAELIKRSNILVSKNSKPIEILYLFTHAKYLTHLIDWKGEENEKEIETFVEKLLDKKINWFNTSKLRIDLSDPKRINDDFIVDLLKAADKDLRKIGYRLIFFEMGWDAYVYTIVESKVFNSVKNTTKDFYGTEKLKG